MTILKEIIVQHEVGLLAQPAAMFVKTANQFTSQGQMEGKLLHRSTDGSTDSPCSLTPKPNRRSPFFLELIDKLQKEGENWPHDRRHPRTGNPRTT